ncbi:MAG TPA: L-threonylcarbamoyladenylate synthase [candidate division Zixibacteria bacterium]|nr:L-threonylcarbamoyladenylate synthase [candidate division Zixibacteria bacterium]
MINSSRIETIDYNNPPDSVVSLAARTLAEGGLVVAPTETRYGLIARADDGEVLDRLYRVKGRPKLMPTAIFVRNVEELTAYAEVSSEAQGMAATFLPGPLTLVLKAARKLPDQVVIEGKIGIRISSSAFIRSLLENIDFPITATSANPSGNDECYTVEEIARHFGGRIDLYVDAGILDGTASTVVDLSSGEPVILRQGAIEEAAIRSALKRQLI